MTTDGRINAGESIASAGLFLPETYDFACNSGNVRESWQTGGEGALASGQHIKCFSFDVLKRDRVRLGS
ncbi:hypothetical protein KOR42_49740 [Thalassoglobus neptunius]|uniref:Uncharacterized protein n=1 Tax=Thalassoglobus neptunius TaxID=1938619 RepID=A0A5C5VN80_9PLAN|nr:hypothetical protein KOR42_49740 [Thalassoglobus neptunius]